MSKIQTALQEEILRLQQRLERERKARIEAEAIAEQGLRALYIRQKESALQQQIAVAANESQSVEKAFQTVLDYICEYTNWPVGHVYICSDTTAGELLPTTIWYLASSRYEPFRNATQELPLYTGGLSDRVLETGLPQWVTDISQTDGYSRQPAAEAVGLKAAFAFPVKIGKKTVAIFEFFSNAASEPNERLLEIMTFVSLQLGRVIERSRAEKELRSYASRLQQTNRELQDIANIVSHDLQEPLRKIQAFSDLIKIKVANSLTDEGRDYIDRMQNAARRMQHLINDLLTFSRVTIKAQPFVPVDLTVIGREVVADLDIRIQQVQGRVEIGNLPTIEADPIQIRQLLLNLVTNGLKFARRDVLPVITISAELVSVPRPRHQALPGPDTMCRITVEDNGIGFEEKYTDRIFGIFQRVHPADNYEGTGMGLAICRKIAERHGGTITARSTPGSGSVFTITLPVRHSEEHPFHA
jgi:signal transduction histidine kinase